MRTKLILLATFIPITIQSYNFVSCPIQLPTINKDLVEVDPHEKKCLAVTIWGEARGESIIGQQAAGYTVINRATKTPVCKVALAKFQYSVFNNNPALRLAAKSLTIDPHLKNATDQKSWKLALEVADDILSKRVADPTNSATHYIADKLMHQRGYKYPKWSKEYMQVASIGGHRFFKKKEITPKLSSLTLALH